ncbi:hypothetical protein V5F63_24350 [Xanthobacter autotrophicus DSM 597]|uniref:hypothetical protein n=1 Tax=Xanthobacteraceae TaxID=335928 RepID=UPI00372654B5
MSDPVKDPHPDRPALPRDAFRAQRLVPVGTAEPASKPVIVTPEYEDGAHAPISTLGASQGEPATIAASRPLPRAKVKPEISRNPFDAYGERSSSRPYALRLPDAIDLVVRQIAAEERTHPLRVIDRILHDHLKRIGRLPPPRGA